MLTGSPTDGIFRAKGELQTIRLVLVQRIRVQNLDVHLPLLEIVRLDDRDSGRQVALHLYSRVRWVSQDKIFVACGDEGDAKEERGPGSSTLMSSYTYIPVSSQQVKEETVSHTLLRRLLANIVECLSGPADSKQTVLSTFHHELQLSCVVADVQAGIFELASVDGWEASNAKAYCRRWLCLGAVTCGGRSMTSWPRCHAASAIEHIATTRRR